MSSYLILLSAAILLAMRSIFDKLSGIQTTDKLFAATVAALASMIVLAIFYLVHYRGRMGFVRANKSEWLQLALIGSSATGIVVLLRFIGLQDSSATFLALNQGTVTMATSLWAFFIVKERLPKLFVPLLFGLTTGVYLVSTGKFEIMSLQQGDIYLLWTAIILGFSNALSKRVMHRLPSHQVTFYRFLFGVVFLLGLLPFGQPTIAFQPDLWYPILSGALSGIFVAAMYESIKRFGASIASAGVMLSPVLIMLYSYAFMDERLSGLQITGAVLALICGTLIPFLTTPSIARNHKR